MRRLLLGFFLAVLSWSGDARAGGSETDAFSSGNTLYAQRKFIEAARAYETDAHRGDTRANLYYNLGNAYFRAGDRGRAILNYQRALLLEPAHTEAAANLAFVRGRVPAPATENGLTAWFGIDRWTWLAAAGGWLAIVGLGASALRRRFRWTLLTAGLVGAVVCGGSVWVVARLDGGAKNPRRAVVLADDTKALYSPADNSKAVSTLPAGVEVLVLSEDGAWNYVELSDGSRGWMASERVEKVVPRAARG